ncbi:MAG: PilZ domain-containing protein [Sphingomonas sp.]
MVEASFHSVGATTSGDAASQRNELRDSLFLMAHFRIIGGRDFAQVRVRNLSAGGLMAEVPAPIPEDTLVELDLRGIGIIRGKIAWNAAGRVGVAFDEQIDPMAARKQIGSGAKKPMYVNPVMVVR